MSFERPSTEQNEPNQIPEGEIDIKFVRSSGPGGQNVNKRSTKAVVAWNVRTSSSFSAEERVLIETELKTRLNKKGEIVITADSTRSQEQNKASAIETLQNLVQDALTPEAERIPTKVSKAKKRKRVEDNRMHSKKKRARGKKDWD
jgi:ribosome-associated protein